MQLPVSLSEQLERVIQQAASLTRTCVQMNLFRFQAKTKRVELVAQNKLATIRKMDFPEIRATRKLFSSDELGEHYWRYLAQELKEVEELLAEFVTDPSKWSDIALDSLAKSIEDVHSAFVSRSNIRSEQDLIEYVNSLADKPLNLLVISEPREAAKRVAEQLREELLKYRTYVIERTELRRKLQERMGLSVSDEVFKEVTDSIAARDSTELLNDEKLLVLVPLKEVYNTIFDKVPMDQEGVTYLDLLQKTLLDQVLFDKVLAKLEADGKVLRDKEVESGEVLYFVELMGA